MTHNSESVSRPVEAGFDRDALRRQAAEILRLRRRRRTYFNASIFGEPAWEILLVLYVNDGVRFKIVRIAELAGFPWTTTTRWLDYLVQNNLVIRESHPNDLRASLIELSDQARESLDSFFSETLTLKS